VFMFFVGYLRERSVYYKNTTAAVGSGLCTAVESESFFPVFKALLASSTGPAIVMMTVATCYVHCTALHCTAPWHGVGKVEGGHHWSHQHLVVPTAVCSAGRLCIQVTLGRELVPACAPCVRTRTAEGLVPPKLLTAHVLPTVQL
jgi:hypothetical protein